MGLLDWGDWGLMEASGDWGELVLFFFSRWFWRVNLEYWTFRLNASRLAAQPAAMLQSLQTVRVSGLQVSICSRDSDGGPGFFAGLSGGLRV